MARPTDLPTDLPPVTLHLGAHRTGLAGLHAALARAAPDLACAGLAVWTPERMRGGLLTGVTGDPGRVDPHRDRQMRRAAGRMSMLRSDLARCGVRRLIVSDPSLMGGLRENVALGRLYPTVSARCARLARVLPGIDRVVLTIRDQEGWWTSAFAHLMLRGFGPPDPATVLAVLRSGRGWHDVARDAAAAFPGAELVVLRHEEADFGSQEAFRCLTRLAASPGAEIKRAAAPVAVLQQRLRDDGSPLTLPFVGRSYSPFTPDARAGLRAAYREDIERLRDGAGDPTGPGFRTSREVPFRSRRSKDGRPERSRPMDAAG